MGWFRWFRKKPKPQHERQAASYDYTDISVTTSAQQEQEASSAPYMLPKDDHEVNRLDFQHYLLRYALRSNTLVPLVNPRRILDVGCGTGRWMAEMAQQFPLAHLVGFDLNVPTLDGSPVVFPANCTFQQGNLLEGLPFGAGSFDLVHQRLLTFALPAERWPMVIQDLVRVTCPGGWIEVVEVDPLFQRPGPATQQMLDLIVRACKSRGIDLSIAQRLASFLQAAGLTQLQSQIVSIPIGDWGGRLGAMARTDFAAGNATIAPLVSAATGVSQENYLSLAEKWIRECEQYHTYCNFYVFYGQRPSSQ